jgi:invasion protein IalB
MTARCDVTIKSLFSIRIHFMKKIIFALVAAVTTVTAIAPAYADDHHHPVCHKVKVHGHWQQSCH